MLKVVFTATGTSQPFFALDDFDLVLPMSGTNSLTIERDLAGTWTTLGSAVTAAGSTHKSLATDFTAPSRFRLNLGTKDSGDVTAYVLGDIIADEVSSTLGAFSIELETADPEDVILENGDYLNTELAA